MKPNRDNYIVFLQLLILILFLSLTLLNEEFDLPCHLLGDPPAPLQHRHGEIIFELSIFFIVTMIYYFLSRSLMKKIKFYEKQKEIIERTFYHDIHNTALSLHGYANLLQKNKNQEKVENYKHVIYHTSRQLLEEIELQRDLSHAEKNELPIRLQELNSIEIVSEVIDMYKNTSFSKDRRILKGLDMHDVDFISDKTIIKRVLGNMVKNALEASKVDEAIALGCRTDSDQIEFYVHNPNFIPKDIQKRIFDYSYSTKGKGRGLGTYSMKLLGERYLKGKIVFHTSAEEGTTFKAYFPLQYKP